MGFIVKVFTIKGNLVFMNNFYHKLAVASICTALGFAIGASEEAKAATFNSSFPYSLTFQVYDGGSFGSFDGLVDAVDSGAYTDPENGIRHSWNLVERTTAREIAAFTDFSIPALTSVSTGYRTDTRITNITRAILRFQVEWEYTFYESPRTLSLFGYVGNGLVQGLDLEGGIFLESVTSSRANTDRFAEFNVTPFLNTLVSNNNEFARFGVRSLRETEDPIVLGYEGYSGRPFPPALYVEGEYEVVPEPTTIFGSAIGLCLGGWLKRKKSNSQNKAKSQA
jgi:hypothetical protein